MQNTTNLTEDTVEIDLQEIFILLLRKLWILILCGIAGGTAAFIISSFVITPLYESTTSVYILNKNNNSTITYSDVQLGTQLTKDYAQLITSRYVLESVIEKYEIDEKYESLAHRISVSTPSDTRLIKITVTDPDPAMAQTLANEVRVLASKRIEEVMDIEAVNLVDDANLPAGPASPSVGKNTLIGIIAGVFLAAAVIIVIFLLDDTIKTSEDVEKYLGLSTLSTIPVIDENNSKDTSKYRNRKSQTAEKDVIVEDL